MAQDARANTVLHGAQVALVTSHHAASRLWPSNNTYTDALTAIGALAATATKPTSDAAAGRCIIAPDLGNFLALQFYAGNADGELTDFNIWGWRPVIDPGGPIVWVPTALASIVDAACGTTVCPEALCGATDGLWVDVATTLNSYVHGPNAATKVEPGSQEKMTVIIDFTGFHLIEIQGTLDTSAWWNGLWWTF